MKTLRVACLYFAPQSDGSGSSLQSEILRVAEACQRWTPQVAVSDVAVFLEIGRCRRLYREKALELRLRALAKRLGCRFRIAFADDAPQALALARFSSEMLPIEALLDYANPFGMDPETFKQIREMCVTLRKLGIKTLASFLALSPKSVPSRFGKLGLLVHQRIREAATIPWPRFMPPERILERAQFDVGQPFHDLEPLFFVLKPVIDRAMARLKGRGERAIAVRLKLKLERYSQLSENETSRSWRWNLALPQGSSVGLMPVLRERLHFDLSNKALPAPVTEMEFEILETAPGSGSQRDFFDAREEEVEAWNSLIGRLVGKLGDGNVFLAQPVEKYFPEASWSKQSFLSNGPPPKNASPQDASPSNAFFSNAFQEGKEAAAPVRDELPDRPLRILKAPIPLLRKEGGIGLLDGSRSWRVTAIDGPEILSGDWWFSQSQRSYFRLETEAGARLWVFQTPRSGTLYLHGYFD